MTLFHLSLSANPQTCLPYIARWNTSSIKRAILGMEDDDIQVLVCNNINIIPEKILKILHDMKIDWYYVFGRVEGKYLDKIIPFMSAEDIDSLLIYDIYDKENLSMALIESLNLDIKKLSFSKQTEEFYDRFKDELDWKMASYRIPLKFVDKFKEYVDFTILSRRLDLSLDFIRTHSNRLYWPFLIELNEDIHEVIQFAPIEKMNDFDFEQISCESYLHEKIIKRFWGKLYIDMLSGRPQKYFFYNRHKDHIFWKRASKVIPLEYVNPEFYPYICTEVLSSRRYLATTFVFKHRDFLCWKSISKNISRAPHDCQIERWMIHYIHPDVMDWSRISRRIPLDLIPDFESYIDFEEVSRRDDLTESFFELYGDRLDICLNQYMYLQSLHNPNF